MEWPETPDEAQIDRVPNPQRDTDYLVRFTVPEFTSLCPVTGQPDFAHLVIDYVPGQWLLESKSLKLYVASFRNHGAFHEDCTVMIGKRIAVGDQAEIPAHRRLLVSARRHSDRRVLADRQIAEGHVDSRPGRRALSRAGVIPPPLAFKANMSKTLPKGGHRGNLGDRRYRGSPRNPRIPKGYSAVVRVFARSPNSASSGARCGS